MSQRIFDTRDKMKELAEKHKHIIVSYSGGKDSLVLMEMATQLFDKVTGLYMYFVKGLRYSDEIIAYGQKRFGVRILQLPHWVYVRCIKYDVYCNYKEEYCEKIPDMNLLDVYALGMQETGATLVMTGARKADSLWRRRWMRNVEKSPKYAHLSFPIKEWGKLDVLAYLKLRNIPVPKMSMEAGTATGIDLTAPGVLWMYDNYRDDYEKMCEVFPFIPAIVKRREFYGINY